jgi:cytochrome oxidase Cu insertion factor (SCO1/SenC/PrrC family)
MEGRLSSTAMPRPPLAVVALAAILVITAAWWALALWPLEPTAPEWLLRTREVCFGATPSGLPHAGGWLLLIGEPIGLLTFLFVAWGTELRAGLQRVQSYLLGRLLVLAVAVAVVSGLFASVRRVAAASGGGGEPFALSAELPARGAAPAADLALTDQNGQELSLAQFRGRWVIVTFAFGHCEDICPVIVEHARRARADESATDFPILVVSLDPWRDTPDRLQSIASAWRLDGEDRVLSGSVERVNATLDRWRIARERDEITGMIAHGSTIALVDPAGREAWRVEGAPQRIREAIALALAERKLSR